MTHVTPLNPPLRPVRPAGLDLSCEILIRPAAETGRSELTLDASASLGYVQCCIKRYVPVVNP